MRIDILTLFPQAFESPLNCSILKRARDNSLIEIVLTDIRDFSTDNYRKVDDKPYGGGPGMILKPEPIFRAVDAIGETTPDSRSKIILMTPQGEPFDQKKAGALSHSGHLIILCGHYRGVDERVAEALVTEEISIGDYILTGGEIPALVIVDSVVRLLPGVLNDFDSAEKDSFSQEFWIIPIIQDPRIIAV